MTCRAIAQDLGPHGRDQLKLLLLNCIRKGKGRALQSSSRRLSKRPAPSQKGLGTRLGATVPAAPAHASPPASPRAARLQRSYDKRTAVVKRRRVQFWGREILLGAGTERRRNLGRSDPLRRAVCPCRGSREGREHRVPGRAERLGRAG